MVLSICGDSEHNSNDDDRAAKGDGMFFLSGIGGGIRSTGGDSGVRAVSFDSNAMSTVNKSLPTKRAGADDFFINRFGNAGG